MSSFGLTNEVLVSVESSANQYASEVPRVSALFVQFETNGFASNMQACPISVFLHDHRVAFRSNVIAPILCVFISIGLFANERFRPRSDL